MNAVIPGSLYRLDAPVGHAYLWRDGDELTLVDTGLKGSGAAIADAAARLGGRIVRLVITHAHEDHYGAAAELGGDVEIVAHAGDAAVVRGEELIAPPVLADWERAVWDAVHAEPLPPAPPVRVDRVVADGEVLDFGGGAVVVHVPGHTPGSIAVHLPAYGVLFAGDAFANVGGRAMPGVFNVDSAMAADSLGRLAALEPALVLPGHGEPADGAALSAAYEAVRLR
ncbi:MBL fold metallo-hydrolase [Actinorhabdospora filicis]|uniref:MBL fold metallo-hydrolase n=1 Tax=Actinorhabdospora filicis TaxID=1785913 RepID=A0A9W6SJH8_9ACTN|nr:MBL fold metallo-hydrolase [Actinorhabdospora filicis]GLZ76771.1 MBL fold metallo-hydrolase [Actinorhabdospora filicis]